MRASTIWLLSTIFAGAGCAPSGLSPLPSGSVPRIHSTTKTILPLPPLAVARLRSDARIHGALARHDDRTAEAEVDARIADGNEGGEGGFLRDTKAGILARRGRRAEALELYQEVIRDPRGSYLSDSRMLSPVLELAVSLGRADAADEVATLMIAHPWGRFYDGVLSTPRTAATARERLAYAYLLIAMDDFDGINHERRVRYARMAQRLLPDSVPVLAQLAYSLTDRRGTGDLDEAAALLRHAYAVTPPDPLARRTVRIFASGERVEVDPKFDVQKDMLAAAAEEEVRQRQARLADEARRRAMGFAVPPVPRKP